jgi:TRAP-type C4-dicarboxylate transport system permease small subunit
MLRTSCFLVGSVGLIAAMAADALAVAGRHVGLPFLGSIELVQAAIVVAASAAIIGATLNDGHATVHILMERLSPEVRRRFQTVADLVSAACFVALAAGSIWLVVDLWRGTEHTELLGLPLKPLRLAWCESAILTAGLFFARAIRPADGEQRP